MPVSSFQTMTRNDGSTQCKLYSKILLIMEYMCCAYSQMSMMTTAFTNFDIQSTVICTEQNIKY